MKIRANNINKRVPINEGEPLDILQNITLNIDSESIIGIVGVSGSGKSTLLGILAGLDKPTQGEVYWDNVLLNQLTENECADLRLKNASFIFQNFELLPSFTALENVLLPLELLNNNDKNAKSKAMDCLFQVGLKDRLHHYPNQLSGGEQQRVAIARAFAVKPKILFADEPTGNLDQKTGNDIIQLIYNLNQNHQTTIICVTHDEALSQICSKIYHLAYGQVIE